jgi:hypothetical protein
MTTETVERRFAAIGARVKISGVGRGEPRVDVRNTAYARQGEWFFVPAPEVDPPLTLVLFDAPLPHGRGRAHVMQFAYRDSEVFAKGAIRHPDHATLVLWGWHRVHHVGFLD